MKERLHYLDWLRIIAILMVLLLHTGKIFDFHTTVVYNQERSLFLSAFREFILLWVMPLFFVISGAAVFLSGKVDKPKEFIKVRFKRLVVPLLFVGTFLVNAVYVYVERLFTGATTSDFFEWYPRFFEGIYGLEGNFASLGNGTYLWYLQFLFIYSLILLPLFKKRKKLGASFLEKLSTRFEKPEKLLMLFLPISVFSVFFEMIGLGGIRVMGGWDLLSYLIFFIYGYLIFSNDKIMKIIQKNHVAYLIVASVLTILHMDSHFGVNLIIEGITRHNLAEGGALRTLNLAGWASVLVFRGLLSWLWVMGILGLGQRILNFGNKYLAYANEAVLPFYILHHAVVYSVGFYVVGWDIGVGGKFLAIVFISFGVIMALYELFIRRFRLVRALFGMKLRKN